MDSLLEKLRGELNPKCSINVIDQCEIVSKAVSKEGDFPGQYGRLSEYLGICQNKLYKMRAVHRKMVPEVKQFFRDTGYQSNKAYLVAARPPEEQLKWLQEVKQG